VASLERIRTEGFRQWYQRQLIECHAWLVSWFLGLIVVFSGVEVAGADTASRIEGALLVSGGLALAWYSLQRYRFMFETAQRLGEQAVCPGCKAYGRFRVPYSGPAPSEDEADPARASPDRGIWLRAQCRLCGVEWMLK
jgi:hypothetical protein